MSVPFNPRIFREYDIRGTVDTELSEQFAYWLGRAYAQLARENGKNNIGIGFDCRLSSPGYAQALARGIAEGGLNCQMTGMGPTPQLYYAVFAQKLGGGIQVTGSHNPPDMNGFKICLGTQTLSGPEIQGLKDRVWAVYEREPKAAQPGTISEVPIQEKYIAELSANSRPYMPKRKLKIVVDGGNGVGGMVGPQVLRDLGHEVIELYCEPDGRFPNHHPDPTVLENLKDLIKTVRAEKADFGIGWDGDADRLGVVDERGEVIFGDMLLLIYGRAILAAEQGATIIGDVKCSGRLFADLKARGGNPIMWKTGHSLIKSKLRETGGALAGEMSGHIFFKHRYYGFDDGVYASVRFTEIAAKHNGPVSSLLSDVPPAISTPEIRVDCPEEIKFQVAEKAQSAFSDYNVNTIDGVRVDFPKGWGLVRASNTQPVLVMRFEADTEENLEKYQAIVVERVEKIKADLAKPN